MMETDAVRRFLRERGCPDEVVSAGLEGLVAEWERTVDQVESGYPLGLDDYLNDLDGRQLLEGALQLCPGPEADAVRARVRRADERMRRRLTPAAECLWGRRVAEAEGWTAERTWWYFGLPREPGPALREDLEGA